jgi:tetratricopeptide (TPR) repeat protein
VRLLLAAILCVSACGQKAGPAKGDPPRRTPAPDFASECWKHRTYGRTADAAACFTRLLASNDPARRAEAHWGLERYQSAVDEFNAAIKARPTDIWVRIRLGELFLERYQPADAIKAFEEAMEMDESHPRALLGMARVLGERWDRRAVELAQKALEADPQLIAARELLARLAAEEGDFEKAIEHASQALSASAAAWDAMAVRGAIDRLEDRPQSPWLAQVTQANPAYGEAFNLAGELLVLNRRYHEGIEFFRQAIQARPNLWEARARLGVNLMRLGQEEEARQQLTLCYENGYRSNPVVNTLRLMDSYKNFVTFRTPQTILRLHKKEAEVLEPYFQSELDRVIGVYTKKYGHEVKTPIQVEVYPDHEDFAVRTMGMPGLGALGVSFGPIVAMDSPTGRRPGSFHWASTLWHEMSHVYALDMTRFRVPRWFTEGLAVYEETAASPDWGDRLDPPSILAIRDKKLLPVEKLDRGFIRPSYPAQVTVSYFQAGRVCQYVANQWGYPKLIEMLRDYGERKPTKEVFESRLGISPEEFV